MIQKYGFVMMVQEEWWIKFLERTRKGKSTHSFVLRGFAPPKNAARLFFYVAKPVKALCGWADFIERVIEEPNSAWNKLGDESVLNSAKEFKEFIGDIETVTFVRFKNLQEAVGKVSLDRLRRFLGKERLSRKGFYINKETADRLITTME